MKTALAFLLIAGLVFLSTCIEEEEMEVDDEVTREKRSPNPRPRRSGSSRSSSARRRSSSRVVIVGAPSTGGKSSRHSGNSSACAMTPIFSAVGGISILTMLYLN